MEKLSEDKKSKQRISNIILILLAFIIGIGMAWGWQQWQQTDQGVQRSMAAYGGDFELDAAWGKAGLADYRGKLVLLYFGFTSCPDVCPTSLGTMKKAVGDLTEQEQQQIRGLFVTIDPERDTAERVEQYAQFFHPNFHGLSGSPEAIAHVARQYGVIYRKVESESSMGYSMDHSSWVYLLDKKGELKTRFQHGVTPAEMTDKIREAL